MLMSSLSTCVREKDERCPCRLSRRGSLDLEFVVEASLTRRCDLSRSNLLKLLRAYAIQLNELI